MSETILLVDDDEKFRSRLGKALNERGYSVLEANGKEAAIKEVEANPRQTEFAVVDMKMPGESGLDVIAELKRMQPNMTIIVLTGYGSIATTKDAVKLGALDYLTKPSDADEILAALHGEEGVRSHGGKPASVPSLARVEWEHIQRVLEDCEGNVSKAARVLGIHRRSLQRKLAKNPPPVNE